jgi:hypothetical protein
LTNAFSQELENFEAAVSLNFAYYNLCKLHGARSDAPRRWPLGSNPANGALRSLLNAVANKDNIDRLTVAVMQLK